MSGVEKLEPSARIDTKTLGEQLAAIGIRVPPQDRMTLMKEAMRIGLSPHASRLRVRCAWWRRFVAVLNTVHYRVFAWDEFDREHYVTYGGQAPTPIRRDAERIKMLLPHVDVQVHATFDDPWLAVEYGGETLLLRAWYRVDRYHAPEVVV